MSRAVVGDERAGAGRASASARADDQRPGSARCVIGGKVIDISSDGRRRRDPRSDEQRRRVLPDDQLARVRGAGRLRGRQPARASACAASTRTVRADGRAVARRRDRPFASAA
jgi:hypothetical protein